METDAMVQLPVTSTQDMIIQAQKKYDFIRMTWCDINAVSRSKVVASNCFEKFLRHGMDVYSGAIALGYNSDVVHLKEVMALEDGNCMALPVLNTLHDVSWTNSKFRVGEVLCETYWIESGKEQPANPRYVARRQLGALEKMGFKLYSTYESEFVVVDAENQEACVPKQSVFNNYALAKVEEVFLQSASNIGAAGVEMESMHTEYGKGQLEFVQRPTFGMKAADGNMILRDCIKGTCLKLGKHATFMTAPFTEGSCSGFHFNHSLFNIESNQNVFGDAAKERKLSDMARHWLAGLVKHSPALCALSSPTINCYRRRGTARSPSTAYWNMDDREAAFRVKTYDAKRTYIENRLASAAANPYLVLAGTVAAGLDGLVNSLELPPAKDPAATLLPQSLPEALNCLENDKVLVQALGEGFVDWFLQLKRALEVDVFSDWAETRDHAETLKKEHDLYYTYL